MLTIKKIIKNWLFSVRQLLKSRMLHWTRLLVPNPTAGTEPDCWYRTLSSITHPTHYNQIITHNCFFLWQSTKDGSREEDSQLQAESNVHVDDSSCFTSLSPVHCSPLCLCSPQCHALPQRDGLPGLLHCRRSEWCWLRSVHPLVPPLHPRVLHLLVPARLQGFQVRWFSSVVLKYSQVCITDRM